MCLRGPTCKSAAQRGWIQASWILLALVNWMYLALLHHTCSLDRAGCPGLSGLLPQAMASFEQPTGGVHLRL